MTMRNDVYKSLNAKPTEELKKILDKNDKVEYTALAFEVIQEILDERSFIYEKFNSKTSEELQNILDKKKKKEYSNITFKIIEEIMIEKKPKILPQKKSITKNQLEEFEYGGQSEKNDSSIKQPSTFDKYPALSLISSILKFIAYVILVISIGSLIGGVILLTSGEEMISIIMITSSLYLGFISFISMLAFSELIKLFLDIEKNTR